MADMQTALVQRLLSTPAVVAITGQRIRWTLLRPDDLGPRLRLQTISDVREQHLKGFNSLRETRVQADCMADSYDVARNLAEAVIAAVVGPFAHAGVAFSRSEVAGPQDLSEDTVKGFVHRMSIDLLIRHAQI